MEKRHLDRLLKSIFYKHLNPGLLMSIYILRANCKFIKGLKRLFLHPDLNQNLYPNTPLLQYSSQPYRQCFLLNKRLQNVAFVFTCDGGNHAQI